MFAHEDGGPEPEWVKTEREQFSDFRDLNKDGKMDQDEIRQWIMPQDYDHAQAEARHLVYESDQDKVQRDWASATSWSPVSFLLAKIFHCIKYCYSNNYWSCDSPVFSSQDQMLTKEEIIENWNMFVGSQATNYGEDLTRNHDELWALVCVCVCVWVCVCMCKKGSRTSLSLETESQTLLPPPTTTATTPLFPGNSGTDVSVRNFKTNTVDIKQAEEWSSVLPLGVRLGVCVDYSVSDIQEQSLLSIDGAFQPHGRLRCLRDLCRQSFHKTRQSRMLSFTWIVRYRNSNVNVKLQLGTIMLVLFIYKNNFWTQGPSVLQDYSVQIEIFFFSLKTRYFFCLPYCCYYCYFGLVTCYKTNWSLTAWFLHVFGFSLPCESFFCLLFFLFMVWNVFIGLLRAKRPLLHYSCPV